MSSCLCLDLKAAKSETVGKLNQRISAVEPLGVWLSDIREGFLEEAGFVLGKIWIEEGKVCWDGEIACVTAGTRESQGETALCMRLLCVYVCVAGIVPAQCWALRGHSVTGAPSLLSAHSGHLAPSIPKGGLLTCSHVVPEWGGLQCGDLGGP